MIISKNKRNKIKIAKLISNNLFLRNSADELFNYINNVDSNEVIADFNKVQSVTRAFIHQYLINKKNSGKNIIDVNKSQYINDMFKIIERTTKDM